jgi:GNAT superfamily N-acetyltransferase
MLAECTPADVDEVPMLRDYAPADAEPLGRIALESFEQFRSSYSDWTAMADRVSRMPELSSTGELIVAEDQGQIVGGVAYVGPHQPKAHYFDSAWAIIRILVVKPAARGKGLGRLLTEECMRRARRDISPIIALHTTPIMTVALPMYLRMGFTKLRDAPDIYGVPYAVYTKSLA